MSELKEHQFCESDEFFRENPGPLSNETHLYYLKSEADKVIAELKDKLRHYPMMVALLESDKKEIAELKDKCQMHDFFWEGCGFAKRGFKNSIAVSEAYDFLEEENKQLQESITVYQRNEKISIRELRHQKYKRCLAMADYAMYHHFRMLEIYGRSLNNDRAVFKINYGLRWHYDWLAIAKKFKEAK